MTKEQAIEEARELYQRRQLSGFHQPELDEAARQGFANDAFEQLQEDVPAMVKQFYPEAAEEDGGDPAAGKASTSVGSKLESKVAEA